MANERPKIRFYLLSFDQNANRLRLYTKTLTKLGYYKSAYIFCRKGRTPEPQFKDFDFEKKEIIWYANFFHLVILILLKSVRGYNCKNVLLANPIFLIAAPIIRFYGGKVHFDEREMYIHGTQSSINPGKYAVFRTLEIFEFFVNHITTVDSHKEHWKIRKKRRCKSVSVVFNVPSINSIPIASVPQESGPVLKIVNVGAIKNNQGFEELFKAVKLSSLRYELHLIGIKSEGYYLPECPSNLEVFEYEQMHFDKLVKFIQKFDLGIMTKVPTVGQYGYIGAGNSRKPFTYMCAGLPVIAPSYRSVAIQVETQRCGYRIDTTDPKVLKSYLELISKNKVDAQSMGRRGQEAIKSRYNWEKESEKIDAIWK